MTHEEALQLLSARVDGELTAEQERELDAWLVDNPDGRIVAEAFRSQDAELRREFEPRRLASQQTAERVAAQLAPPIQPVRPPQPASTRGRWWMLIPPLAAVASVALVFVYWMKSPHVQEVTVTPEVAQRRAETRPALPFALLPKPLIRKELIDSKNLAEAVVGQNITTQDGAKKRQLLPDGSVLYLDQNTTVSLKSDREVYLEKGRIFVEAIPAVQVPDNKTFRVTTSRRKLEALGTKFAVDSAGDDMALTVTQGSVKISGAKQPVLAGQTVKASADIVENPVPAKRASHELDWTRELMIAADSPLIPAGKYDGGALIAVDPYGQDAKLSLRKYHIDVHIEDGFARTTIDQTYFNYENMQMEGTFYFPLPPDASLSRLAMYVADGEVCNLMEGGMAERDHARQTYERIRHARRDPALLEWVDGSLFKMRVFPLEARQEKRIILSYSQKLPVQYGRTSYRFPAGHTLNVVNEWSFAGRVKNGAGLAANCPSHPDMKIAKRGDDLVLNDKAKTIKPDRDVVIELNEPTMGQGEAVRWSSAEHEGAKYLMLRYRPELTGAPKRERRDWVFLFEASGARDPLVARAQIEVIRALLNNAEHDDTFAILTVGTRIHQFQEEPRRATAENVQKAIEFLEKTHLIGALNLEQALIDADPLLQAGTNPHLVHVGGGIASLGEQRADKLIPRIPQGTKYVGVAVGKRFSPNFMKVAAEKTGGFFTNINPDEPIAWRGFELAAALNTPRLLNIEFSAPKMPGVQAVRWLTMTNALSQGEELTAIARIDDEVSPASVWIHGKVGESSFDRTLQVKNVSTAADYLPRTWAKLEIDRLLAEDAGKHRQAIIDLSKAMYVMTPFTSLLVLENEAMYKEFNVDRGRKDHWALYACPDKIPVIDPNQPASGPQMVNQKPHANQVKQTVMMRTPPSYLTQPGHNADRAPVVTASTPVRGESLGAITAGQFDGGQPIVEFTTSLGRTWYDESAGDGIAGLGGDGKLSMLGDHYGMLPRLQLSETREVRLLATRGFSDRDRDELAAVMNPEPRRQSGRRLSRGTDGKRFSSITAGIDSELSLGEFDSVPVRVGEIKISGNEFRERLTTLAVTNGPMLLEPQSAAADGFNLNFSDFNGEFLSDSLVRGREFGLHYSTNGGLGASAGRGGDVRLVVLSDGTRKRIPVTVNRTRISSGEELAMTQYFFETAPSSRIDAVLHDNPQGPAYYGKTMFAGQERVFTDLASYAPGMSSSRADVQAVLEAEALPRAGIRRGTIDPAARQRIDAARTKGWRALNFTDDTGAEFVFRFDGQGRYAYERKVGLGLIERVVCDGSTILHLYPELGIGARRPASRFHRAEVADLISDFVLPADDLNYGCDVKLVKENTVALIPLPPINMDEDKKPGRQLVTHLIFDGDRLVERKFVMTPEDKLFVRETYDAAGLIRTYDRLGKELAKEVRDLQLAPEAPELNPDVSSLVILPLPLRSRHHVYRKYDLDPDNSLFDARNRCFEYLAPDAAMELLAAEFAANRGSQVDDIWQYCFAKQGDRRIGFFTLMMSSSFPAHSRTIFKEELRKMVAAGTVTPLMRYLSLAFEPKALAWQRQFGLLPGAEPAKDFLSNLLTFRAITMRWNAGAIHDDLFGSRPGERERALAFANQHADNVWGWSALALLAEQADTEEFHHQVADAWGVLAKKSGLTYKARYEQAANLRLGGKNVEASEKFNKLFADTFARGVLPPIDNRFREAFTVQAWTELMHDAARKLLTLGHRPLVVSIAWQCRQLGDVSLADELLAIALREDTSNPIAGAAFIGNGVVLSKPIREADRVRTLLAAVEYLMAHNETEHADRLVRILMEMPKLQSAPSIQRLAAKIAERRDNRIWQFTCLEKALDLEYARMPEVFSVEPVRQDYSNLLSHYEWLADASRNLKVDPPADLTARVVRAADRWRSLDPDATASCERAAKVLRMIGGKEVNALAWEFMTTPLAMKPNESDPWLALAGMSIREGNLGLADRCYEAAFAAEPTNAQILWDRGKLLERRGEIAASMEVMKQIAAGDWQPRFEGLKLQAKEKVMGK